MMRKERCAREWRYIRKRELSKFRERWRRGNDEKEVKQN